MSVNVADIIAQLKKQGLSDEEAKRVAAQIIAIELNKQGVSSAAGDCGRNSGRG